MQVLLVLTHALKGINEESEEDDCYRKHYCFGEEHWEHWDILSEEVD